MSFIEIVLLGIGLAMDCFAVSLSKGVAARKIYPLGMLSMAFFFGLFQAGMPLIGYFAGNTFSSFTTRIAPWIALVLLGFIGGKMVLEHFEDKKSTAEKANGANAAVDYKILSILVLAVATSIDALATGVIFVGQESTIWIAVLVIGLCSFIASVLGSGLGALLGGKFKFPAELFGGLILIGIGLKIWLEGILS